MHIQSITVTKPHAAAKLGFKCNVTSRSATITSVDEHGLFAGTDLRTGQEILRINGTAVPGIGSDAVMALLASLPSGDVSLIVKSNEASTNNRAIFKANSTGTRYWMERRITEMPQILRDASVPQAKWWWIYSLIQEELMPASTTCIQSNERYNYYVHTLLKSKDLSTMISHDKAIHGTQLGILHNNVTLVAMSVKDRVNAILSSYHITAVLAYESIDLPRHPSQKDNNQMAVAVGLNFVSMEYLTVCAVPAEQAITYTMPIVAVPVPTAPSMEF